MQTETKIEGMNITEVQSCNTEVQSRNTGVNPRKKIKKGQKEKKTDVPEDKMENDVPDGKSGKDFVLEPNRTTVPTVHQEIPKVCFFIDIHYKLVDEFPIFIVNFLSVLRVALFMSLALFFLKFI